MVEKSLFVKVAKLLNFVAAGMMVLDAILRWIDFKNVKELFFLILSLYLLGFAILLVVAELRIKSVLIYIEFLKSRIGLGIYVTLIGLLVFDESRNYDIGISVVLVVIGVMNLIIGIMRDSKANGQGNSGNYDIEGVKERRQYLSQREQQ